MARRKDLAGLAALGALGYMLRDKKGADRDTVPGTNIPIAGGESEAETFPNEYRYKVEKDFGGSSNIGEGYGPAPSSMMRREPVTKPRSRPVVRPSPTAAPSQTTTAPAVVSDAQRQYDEANARARTPEGRAERARMESSQALEAIRPEEAVIGGGGLKTVAAMARGLANRRGAEKLAEYSVPRIGTEPLKIGTEPLKMTGPSKAELVARDRAARAAAREAERSDFNKRGVDRFVESTFEGGMKRGGKVKKMASGGMARSSASSRADGIASRGKTRGKVC